MSTILPYALTTKAKVKSYLGIATADTSKDDLIIDLINQVTWFIETYCGGRRFMTTTYTNVILDSRGGNYLFLNHFPVTAFTLLEYRSGTVDTPVWVTYATNSYLAYLAEGYLYFYGRLPVIHQGFRVTYTAGYLIDWTNETTATHTLPFDLTLVATELAAKQYNYRQAQGIESMSTEGQSITFGSKGADMTKAQTTILNSYKTARIGI